MKERFIMATISKLATSQYASKNYHSREGNNVRFLIPHHMAAHWTGAQCAKYFVNNSAGTSANYCIGYNGDIASSVPEDFSGYTSGSKQADKRAITFECSDAGNNDWHIPEATQESLIKMMVDCIQRYPSLGGKAVFDPEDEARVIAAKKGLGSWDDVKGNILYHRWTTLSGTSCPEWHMMQIMPSIVAEVNRRLGVGENATSVSADTSKASQTKRTLFAEAQYMIDNKINGEARKTQAKADGFKYDDVQAEIDLILAKDKAAVVASVASSMPEIQKGSKGDVVKILQTELKQLGYYTGTIDGDAGNLTDAAIKAAQTNWNKVYGNFSVDGKFGTKCWIRLLLGK